MGALNCGKDMDGKPDPGQLFETACFKGLAALARKDDGYFTRSAHHQQVAIARRSIVFVVSEDVDIVGEEQVAQLDDLLDEQMQARLARSSVAG